MRWDLHTHYYPEAFFRLIEDVGGAFSFGTDPTGRTIIPFRGARFFGVTPPMNDPAKRLEDIDRVGIDVEVLSLSTPNVFFARPSRRPKSRACERRLRRAVRRGIPRVQGIRLDSDGRPRCRAGRARAVAVRKLA